MKLNPANGVNKDQRLKRKERYNDGSMEAKWGSNVSLIKRKNSNGSDEE